MMPATSQSPKNIRKQIGPAVWLLVFLGRFAPAEWVGDNSAWVAGGNVISDAELAERLGASVSQVANWRRRLRSAGVIGWYVAPRQGRVFWLEGLNRVLEPQGESKPERVMPAVHGNSMAAAGEEGAQKTEPATEPAISKWVQ